jgi:dipeptidyl-peptidase-4
MSKFTLSFFLLLVGISIQAQETITLENLWKNYAYTAKRVPGFNFQNDGKHYTRLEENVVKQYDLTTGLPTKDLFVGSANVIDRTFNGKFDNYTFNADETKMLISTGTESIYRRSSKANYFVYDKASKTLSPLFEGGKQMYATFNAQSDKVAFVFENNIYYKDLKTDEVIQVTNDGEYNNIINGSADWVYEEEFAFAKAFFWSPDGRRIAFYRFDESEVREFTMTNYTNEMYPEYVTFKYPKVGEDNAKVSIHVYGLKGKKTTKAQLGSDWEYIPRITWTKDPNKLCVTKMNRHQNKLELTLVDATTGAASSMLSEENKYYIDITDHLTFLEDGERFIWTSEQDGYNHIYLYNMSGKMEKQLTKGDYDVTTFYGVDEKNGQVYYQAAKIHPIHRELYSVGINGKKDKKISAVNGWNTAQFSSTFDYYVNTHSTANAAPTYKVYDRNQNEIRVIEDNARMAKVQQKNKTQTVDFFDFKTSENVQLNGYMIKPANFDANKKYPVLMYVYGGPGSQTVEDTWGGQNYWWFQMLAQKGYIVVSVDNRGTGARGQEFKKMTYQQLGKYETMDQIEAAKYLAQQSYVDAERIGIFGWSYGGYMSSLCLSKGADVFKTAIAVAPVTNWKWYDSIYTERYMRTYAENKDGFEQNSPINFANLMEGNYLIVHGISDDNVHFQNAAEMVAALQSQNKRFDSLYYPNKNHGIYGGLTRLHLYTEMTDFLLEKL